MADPPLIPDEFAQLPPALLELTLHRLDSTRRARAE
jgi:hypothetical protein